MDRTSFNKEKLTKALNNDIWQHHTIGDQYAMKGDKRNWKIAYYPIFADGKTGEEYEEPRALVETPIVGGIDLREVPLRYLTKL